MEKDEEITNFLSESSEFINEFESKFVNNFISLSLSYDKFYPTKTLEKVAYLVYEDIFSTEILITTPQEEVISDMLNDGIMIGFLLNRSMFFILENYIKYEKKKEKNLNDSIETLVSHISKYINQFEEQVYYKSKPEPTHVNFDTFDNFSIGSNTLDIFQDIKDNGEEVTFFNLYKGIPIRHKAIVIDIDKEEEKVAFRTVQTQEVAMQMDGVAYILKDNNLNKYIKADIVYNNFFNNTVVLNNFTYLLNMPATQREFIRVHPEVMVKVTLSNKEELATNGKLFDLSVDGLGVISEENNGIYAGAEIELSFSLNISSKNEEYNIKVKGKILNIIEYSNSYRYCIKIYPTEDMEKKIKDYVKLREVEIIDTLNKELSDYAG